MPVTWIIGQRSQIKKTDKSGLRRSGEEVMWMITWKWAQIKQIWVTNVNCNQRDSISREDLFSKVERMIIPMFIQWTYDQSSHSRSD